MSWIDKIKSKTSVKKKDPANTELWAECQWL